MYEKNFFARELIALLAITRLEYDALPVLL